MFPPPLKLPPPSLKRATLEDETARGRRRFPLADRPPAFPEKGSKEGMSAAFPLSADLEHFQGQAGLVSFPVQGIPTTSFFPARDTFFLPGERA